MPNDKTQIRITITRVELLRLLAGQIRKKTREWERAKRKYPRQLMLWQKKAIKLGEEAFDRLRDAETYEQVQDALRKWDIEYRFRNSCPSPPKLNVCRETELVKQLQFEKREKLSLRATDAIWTLVGMDKCETRQ
jgi:hypothetical protein